MAIINGIGRVGIRNYVAPVSLSSIVSNGLILNLDAGNATSYPGTGTTWTDLSVNGNNGTLINGVSYGSSNGGGLTFDGVNDYVITSNNLGISGDSAVSISTWVKLIELGSGSYGFRTISMFGNVYSSGGGMGIMHRGNGTLSVAFYQGLAATSLGGIIAANNWYNITITKSPGAVGVETTKMYVNGVAQTLTFNTSITPNFANTKAYIGTDVANEISNNMVIGNTLIYSKALTSTEVVQNFDATKGRFGYATYPTSLKLFIDAGNTLSYSGTGTDLYDLSGNKNNSILTNGVSYGSSNGGVLTYDGINDYTINTSQYLVGSTQQSFCVSAWIKMNANPIDVGYDVPSVIDLNGNGGTEYMSFGPLANRQLKLRWFDGSQKGKTGNTVLSLNTWYYITCSVSNNVIKLYVNGVEESSYTGTDLTNRAGDVNSWKMGSAYYGTFVGSIPQLKYYNDSRTPAQITTDFNEFKSRYGY